MAFSDLDTYFTFLSPDQLRLEAAVIEDETQIPREFMEPNLKAIGAYGRSLGPKAKMAGVRFENRPIMAMRS